MSSYFNPAFFINNRQHLLELFRGSAPIVITANGLLQRSGDVTYPFKQDANFWYLTGINLPDVILVMDKGTEYLIIPDRSHILEVFDGPINKTSLAQRSGIKNIYGPEEGWAKISPRLKKVNHIATIAAP